MKTDFKFKDNDIASQFKQLSPDNIKQMAKDFVVDTDCSITSFAQKVRLNPTVVGRWLNGKETLGERSLKRIFAFLSESYSKYQELIK